MSSVEATKRDARGRPIRGTRWRARFRDVNGRSRSKTFDRKLDAERFIAGTTTDMARGDWVDPRSTSIRFDELADTWWATTMKLVPTTRRGDWQLLENHVRPHFGTRMQGSIGWVEVEQFIAGKLADGHSPKRVRDMVSIVSSIMKSAVRAGLRRDNPAADHSIPVRRAKVGRAAVLNMTEVHRLVDHTRNRTSLRCGCWRPSVYALPSSAACVSARSTSRGHRPRHRDAQRRTPLWRREAHARRGPHEVDRRRPVLPCRHGYVTTSRRCSHSATKPTGPSTPSVPCGQGFGPPRGAHASRPCDPARPRGGRTPRIVPDVRPAPHPREPAHRAGR